jgi:putative transposase
VLTRFADFAAMLESGDDEAAMHSLRRPETIGRPIGSENFVRILETLSARQLAPAKRGPKGKKSALSP